MDAFEFEKDAPYAALIHQSECEQGFAMERVGEHRYEIADFDGLQLVTVRHRPGHSDDQLEGLPDPPW